MKRNSVLSMNYLKSSKRFSKKSIRIKKKDYFEQLTESFLLSKYLALSTMNDIDREYESLIKKEKDRYINKSHPKQKNLSVKNFNFLKVNNDCELLRNLNISKIRHKSPMNKCNIKISFSVNQP